MAEKEVLSCAGCGYPIAVSAGDAPSACPNCGIMNEVVINEFTHHIPSWLIFTLGGIIAGVVINDHLKKGNISLYGR